MEGHTRKYLLTRATLLICIRICFCSSTTDDLQPKTSTSLLSFYNGLKKYDYKIMDFIQSEKIKREGEKQCVMYDVYKSDQDSTSKMSMSNENQFFIAYDGPPKQLDKDSVSLKILEAFCPELIEEYGNELCCSEDQIGSGRKHGDLIRFLRRAQSMFGKCPSCFHNLRQLFCDFTCSPFQNQFVKVSQTKQIDNKNMVKALEVMVMENYVSETFDSCKSISAHALATSSIMDVVCEPWTAANCTAIKWFNSMAARYGKLSSVDTRFKYFTIDDNIEDHIPFYYTTIPCDQIPPNSQKACSCGDCPSSPKCPSYEKKCVMFDKCGHQPGNDFQGLNCVYDGPPKPFNIQENKPLFWQINFYCPELFDEHGLDLCCSVSQMEDLIRSLGYYYGILYTCPSCWYNYRQFYCNMICSPYQYTFVNVNETIQNPSTGKDMAKKLDVFMSEKYINETYASCRTLLMNSPSAVPLDFLCGTFSNTDCTPQQWFNFIGRYSTKLSSKYYTSYDVQYMSVTDTRVMIESPGKKKLQMQIKLPFDFPTLTCAEIPPTPSGWKLMRNQNNIEFEKLLQACPCDACDEACSARIYPSK